jgi:HSP20 family molecular chaperone IbpA
MSTENTTQINETEKNISKNRITPKYGVYTEEDKVILQVAIPGVQKDAIRMKAMKDFFTLRAERGEDSIYMLDLDFGVKIEPEKTTSSYEEGLLRLEFQRYKPLDHAFVVPIQ